MGMDSFLLELFGGLPIFALLLIIGASLFTLAKGADVLVEEAVTLSLKWGVPKMLIGATIVSIGTTLPEAAVSVFAAMGGRPGLALGNSVGSIVCDTGLILGLSAIVAPLKLQKPMMVRQSYLKIAAVVLLVAVCLPYSNLKNLFTEGGVLPRWAGFLFLGLLVVYVVVSIRQAKSHPKDVSEDLGIEPDPRSNVIVLLKLVLGILVVLVSSKVLIPTVQVTAARLLVPESIIAATLVAFGTSLPELVTAVTAAKRGHGELAIGNIIGADILNVLFVSGAAAAVTKGGLAAPPHFFVLLFPSMLILVAVFSIAIQVSKKYLGRAFGAVLMGMYVGYTVLSYIVEVT